MILSFFVFGYSFYLYQLTSKKRTKSDLINFDNLKWIKVFFRLGLLAYIFWLFPLIITIVLGFKIFIPSYYPLRVLTTILIYWLGYQSILQLKISRERKIIRKNSFQSIKSSEDKHQRKTKNDCEKLLSIPINIINDVLNSLETFEQNKLYTTPNISLNSLAKEFNTNANYLSKIINNHKGMSFNNYINSLRIENTLRLLEEKPIIRKFTIKAIALEAGYNNSDSFSKVFFKLKGVKPSEYIKMMDKKITG